MYIKAALRAAFGALLIALMTLPGAISAQTAEPTLPATTEATLNPTTSATVSSGTLAPLPACPAKQIATAGATSAPTAAPTVSGTTAPTSTIAPTPTANPNAGYLGIGAEQVQRCGARIQIVRPDSPADKAGLQAGDVIVALNGQPISSLPEVQQAVRLAVAGDTLRITYQRGNVQTTVAVKLGSIPADLLATAAPTAATRAATTAPTRAATAKK